MSSELFRQRERLAAAKLNRITAARQTATAVSNDLDLIGSDPGTILIRDTDSWDALGPGTVGQILTVGADSLPGWDDAPATGVTSVSVSGGTTGLTTSGGPITSTGTITLAGTLAVANGGTGGTTAGTARAGLGLPNSLTGSAGLAMIVKGDETGFELGEVGSGVLAIDPTVRTGNFTLSAADQDYDMLLVGSGSDITVTVPTNASVAWDVGRRISIHRTGAGRVTVAAAGGVTMPPPTGATLEARDQYSTVTLIKRATDTWVASGDLKPSSQAVTRTRCIRTTNQSISNGTWNLTTWDAEDFDDDGAHSTSSNTSRIIVPSGKTRARFRLYANFATTGTGLRAAAIHLNSGGTYGASTAIVGAILFGVTSSSANSVLADTDVISVTPGDYYEGFVIQSSGGALNMLGPSGSEFGRSFFQAEFWA